MKKPVFYTELAYVLAMALLALGTAMLAQGNFGISMVVAPAYILHLKLSQFLPWFSFGMAEYLTQGLILCFLTVLMRKFRLSYLLSILATVFYGFLLDGAMALVGLLPGKLLWVRLSVYALGILVCTAALSLLFHSYFPPAAYELLVKELAKRLKRQIPVIKTLYDCGSLAVGLLMSLVLFGKIVAIGLGTLFCAAIYGVLISGFNKVFESIWEFRDRFGLREKFEESEQMQ